MSNGYPQPSDQVVAAGFFDSDFAGALVVVLAVELVLLLESDFLDSDLAGVVALEPLELLSPEARESVR
jgi:hypothetical protein